MKKIDPPFVRSPYNYDLNAASEASGLYCHDKTLAQQQFAEESDINFIADRYGLTGELPTVQDLPRYGDFTGVFDFQSANQAIINARNQFMTLPAKIRARFDNDPQKLMAFLDDPNNLEEARFLGIANKAKAEPQSTVAAPADPDRANPAPDPDKPLERATPKPSKKDKTDT